MHTANDSSETEVIRFIYVCLALFFCKSREKDNEEEDAKDENGNDEKAAGMLGGGIRRRGGGSAAVCKAWLLQQLFTILITRDNIALLKNT